MSSSTSSPPQQRIDEQWYQGTADAVYQNIYTHRAGTPRAMWLFWPADHIYKMDYSEDGCLPSEKPKADLTIAALEGAESTKLASFGVMQTDSENNRIIGFEEKPDNPKTVPGDDQDHCLASMGIYVFDAPFLFDELCRDATLPDSAHDFGKNIIPSIIDTRRVFAFPFRDENQKAQAYWRDVGTVDSYYEANLELTNVEPQLNLYDDHWPIRTHQANLPPAKTVFAEAEAGSGEGLRRGEALDSVVCPGAILSGGVARKCVIGPASRINSYAHVEESILFAGVNVGRRCRIRRAIIDKGVHLPEGTEVGYDLDADRARGYTISDKGVVVIAKADGAPAVR